MHNMAESIMDNRETPLQLDLSGILRRRMPRRISRLVPGFMLRALENLIRQDDLNALLRGAFPATGSAFSRSVMDQLGIEVETVGLDAVKGRTRLVFASNHPLGGLDGITMVRILGETFGDDNIRVMVNDMLMHVEPLAGVFLPINKYGGQARESARLINAAYASGMNICVYPAGLVSRLGDDGEIQDLKWQKAVAAKALEFDRDIVPVRFEALNSPMFYKAARFRKKSGLKVNIEQALLPRELFSQRGKRFRVIFGMPVSAKEMRESGKTPSELAAMLRDRVYSL